jgi:hypothetical protein
MVPQQPLSGGDVDQLLANIQIIFDASKSFEDACFADFAQALSGLGRSDEGNEQIVSASPVRLLLF